MTSTDILTRHAPRTPVDPDGLTEARLATFDRLDATVTPLPARHGRPAQRWGVAAAGVAVLTVAGLTLPSLGDQPAFAGWSEVPTAADPAALAANTDSCVQLAAENPSMPVGPAAPVLSELRGPWSFTVADVGGVLLTCLEGPSQSFATGFDDDGAAYGWVTGEPRGESDVSMVSVVPTGGLDDPEPGELTVGAGSSYGNDQSGRWSAVLGRVASDVGSVRVVLDDGTVVDASASEGVFAAWWPSAALPVEVTGVRADGSPVSEAWGYAWPE